MMRIFDTEEIDGLYPGQVKHLSYSELCILKEKVRFTISELEYKEPEAEESREREKWKRRMRIMQEMKRAVDDAILFSEV